MKGLQFCVSLLCLVLAKIMAPVIRPAASNVQRDPEP
jgi:hypothetical protein